MSHTPGYTWDQFYLDEYAKGKELVLSEKHDEFAIWVSKYLKQKNISGANILDAGCGEGRNSIYFGKQGFKTYGIDISSPAIEKAKRRVKSEALTKMVNLRLGDVTNLPYDEDFFDAVYDSFTMEFIPKREQYVEEVARVLKPKGLFFILTHILPAKHGLNPEYLEKMLKKNFEILKIDNPSDNTLTVVAERR